MVMVAVVALPPSGLGFGRFQALGTTMTYQGFNVKKEPKNKVNNRMALLFFPRKGGMPESRKKKKKLVYARARYILVEQNSDRH